MARLRNKRALERRLEALEAQVGSRWSAGTARCRTWSTRRPRRSWWPTWVHVWRLLLADAPEPEPPAGYQRALQIVESRSSPLSHSEAEQLREELNERFDRRAKAREQEQRDALPRGGDGQ